MSTAVILNVTPLRPVDPHRRYHLPEDLSSLLSANGLAWTGGMSRSGDGPWRLNIRVSGPDKLAVGHRAKDAIASLGYQVELSIFR